jgi:response regulator RpfG family c-di-GMP phosphodiesterase
MDFKEFRKTKEKMSTVDYMKKQSSWWEHTHKEVFVYMGQHEIEIHHREGKDGREGCTYYIASPLDGTLKYQGLELEVAERFVYDSLVEHGTIYIQRKPEKVNKQLEKLWEVMKREGDCTEYVDEMLGQLLTLGTETNTKTKHTILDKMKDVVGNIQESLEEED